MLRGNYLAVPLVGGALLFAGVAIWLGIWLNHRRMQIMFRNPTPDKLIESYHATLLRARARKIPHADAATAQLSALAATVYGQFDRARDELDAVDWEKAPAMYQGHRLDVLALIALLEKHDQSGALRLVRESGALERTGAAGAPPILHNAILVATGECDAETVQRVEKAANRKVGALPAVSAWALAMRADLSGHAVEAGRYRDLARQAAPHFVGLAGS